MKRLIWTSLIMCFLVVGCTINNNEESKVTGKPTYEVKNIDDKNAIQEFNESDFIIKYKEIEITVGENPQNVFDAIGTGDANEDNNFGFVDWDNDNKYKYYQKGYADFSLYTKVEVISGNSVISQINLINIETTKGVRVKDSYNTLIEKYGTQYEKVIHDDKATYIYEINKKKLTFDVNKENEIISISIHLIE